MAVKNVQLCQWVFRLTTIRILLARTWSRSDHKCRYGHGIDQFPIRESINAAHVFGSDGISDCALSVFDICYMLSQIQGHWPVRISAVQDVFFIKSLIKSWTNPKESSRTIFTLLISDHGTFSEKAFSSPFMGCEPTSQIPFNRTWLYPF